jgi:hypothetical protein
VPSLRPWELAFQLGGDRPHPHGIAMLGADFYCLPGDPAAGLRAATLVRASAHWPRYYEPATSPTLRCPRQPPRTAHLGLHARADGNWQRRRESCRFSYLLPDEAECAKYPRVGTR